MAGAEIHANAIATVRAGLPLRDAGWPVNAATIVVLALVAAGVALRLSIARSLLCAALAAVVLIAAAQIAFDAGRAINIVFPLLALVLSAGGNAIAAMIGRHGGAVLNSARAVLASPSTRSRTPSLRPRRSAADQPSG